MKTITTIFGLLVISLAIIAAEWWLLKISGRDEELREQLACYGIIYEDKPPNKLLNGLLIFLIICGSLAAFVKFPIIGTLICGAAVSVRREINN